MDVAGRKARSEPRRQRETSVAPQHQHLPAAQIVPHALQGQGALAADVQAGHALLQELQRTVDPELIVRDGIDAVGQAHEPPAVGIVGGELGRHPELAQGGKVEWRPPGESRLQSLDYLVPKISIHAVKIARNPIGH